MPLAIPPNTPSVTLTVDQLGAVVQAAVLAALAQAGPPQDEILDTAGVAALLKAHPKTIARWVRTEGLPAYRLGGEERGEYRFKRAEVEKWFAARGAKA